MEHRDMMRRIIGEALVEILPQLAPIIVKDLTTKAKAGEFDDLFQKIEFESLRHIGKGFGKIIHSQKVTDVLNGVINETHVTLDELLGPSREKRVCRPRWMAMYRLSRECGLSLGMIVRVLKRTEHKQVIYGIRRYEELLEDKKYEAENEGC